jgi:hypothetical protein
MREERGRGREERGEEREGRELELLAKKRYR